MSNSSNSNSRLSAQNIIDKYGNNNNTEDRFTFQVRPNSPRETFGKSNQPRSSQVQILKEID